MKHLTVLLIAACGSTLAFGQSGVQNNEVESHIAALEQAGWTAWKNKDKLWYLQNTTAGVVWINSDGVTDRPQLLKDLARDCDVRGFALSDYKTTTRTNDLVIMTYKATQDAVCSGKKLPERIRASVVYVKRNGRWLEAFYMETPQARQ